MTAPTPSAKALIEAGRKLADASNTLMFLLAGVAPLTKRTLESALRQTLDARNEWDNAVQAAGKESEE